MRQPGRRGKFHSDFLQDHTALYVVCDDTVSDRDIYRKCEQLQYYLSVVRRRPDHGSVFHGGKYRLLVTWLYKLTVDKQYYNIGAVIGILTFIILAVGALFTYRRSKSYKEEGGF